MYAKTTGAALLENNEASAKLTTANGGTFTSSSARLSSQSRYSTRDCNPGLEFSIPGFGIVEFPIPGSRDPVGIGVV